MDAGGSKVIPKSDTAYNELVIFGDVEARDRFIVQTWHRTAYIENGRISKVVYGYSYPAFPPSRTDPDAKEFYRALLVFAELLGTGNLPMPLRSRCPIRRTWICRGMPLPKN